jgi:superfamily I DNA/RNA helicase
VAPLVARLRSLVGRGAAYSLACCPEKGSGAPTLLPADLVVAEEVGRLPVADLIARVPLAEPAVSRETREAAELLATLAVPFGYDLAGFLEHLPLWQAGDLELVPQRVALLTLHAAKGLEFPLVFIAGCEDGLLPLRFAGREPEDADEERRLLYVGMTRAKSRLVLTRALRRHILGGAATRVPSPFLAGLPADWVQHSERAERRRAEQLRLL